MTRLNEKDVIVSTILIERLLEMQESEIKKLQYSECKNITSIEN